MHVVVVLDHAYVNGGQAKVAIEASLGLVARGHRVTLFAAVGPADPRLAAGGVEVVCLGQPDVDTAKNKLAFAAQVIWNRLAGERLAALLASCDPNHTVVHVHGWAKALSSAIGSAIARSGLPAVYTMHEFFLVCPNGGFYDYQAGEVCHRRPMSGACIARHCDSRDYPRKLLRVARHAALDHVSGMKAAIRHVAVISDLQHQVIRPYMPDGTVYHRVDNPISMPDLGPKPAGTPGDFVFVGRLSPEKGVGLFVEAARRAGVRPVLVGDGPSAGEIRTRYPDAVMLGWRKPEEVRGLMREARALVFPSIWYEGQPLTVYEALALGTPVVVSDVCAGREAVRHGDTGLWFRSGDEAGLTEALVALKDDATAIRMSRAAYDTYWAAPLTLERHLDRLREVYAAARADRRGARVAAERLKAAIAG